MPIIDLKISGSEDADIAGTLVEAITSATKESLNKKPEVTAITISFISSKFWFVNGIPLEKTGQRSFYLGIKITERTVSKHQKEEYLKKIDMRVKSILGDLHQASYVYVAEVQADAYGYSGETMGNRLTKMNTPSERTIR
jgi:4-oxalocrotonate tautomerase